MTEIPVNSSDSDISINSWSLIDDHSSTEDLKFVKASESSSEIIEIEPEATQKEPKEEAEVEENNDGFLTFDEFLQEKLLEEVEKPTKRRKLKRGKKGTRKSKAQNLGISVFIAIVLAMTAFGTICSSLSQLSGEKETEEVAPVDYATATKKQNEDIIRQINESLREMERIKNVRIAENKFKNVTLSHCPKLPTEVKRPQPSFPQPKLPNLSVFKNVQKPLKNKPKVTKSKWMKVKEILMDTNMHALASLVMTNIYLFTLLADLTRRTSTKKELKQKFLEDLERSDNMEEVKKYLFKELPFWNFSLSEINVNKKKKSISKKEKINNKTTNTIDVETKNKKTECLMNNNSCPMLTQKTVYEELGKSECQRRFDQLDSFHKKFNDLKQSQRDRIKLLKQKFRNEVSFIRDTEEESEARAEKINKTSQRFIRKLKVNRERYLLELKKVKELRQKLAGGKEVKDHSTECYSVALPPVYDYGVKFQLIKEKFEKGNQLPKEWKFSDINNTN